MKDMELRDIVNFVRSATRDELDAIVHEIKDRGKELSNMAAYEFRPGTRVTFDARRRGIITGVVTGSRGGKVHVTSDSGCALARGRKPSQESLKKPVNRVTIHGKIGSWSTKSGSGSDTATTRTSSGSLVSLGPCLASVESWSSPSSMTRNVWWHTTGRPTSSSEPTRGESMNTYLPIHSGKRFTWTGNVGVTEASVLGRNHTGRVWPDSCDTGFIVRSHKTGTDKVFVYHGALSRSQDVSDVYAHVYRSRDGFEVRVLNT